MEVRPFTIHVPDDVLDHLRWRLGQSRFPDEIPGSGWDYGCNLDYLKDLVHYWRTDFDWRAQEANSIADIISRHRWMASTFISSTNGALAPAGMALFPQEIARPPREWGERSYHTLRWAEMPKGGHFAAWEEPALLAQEVRAFFHQFR